jgi:hypothetical protein
MDIDFRNDWSAYLTDTKSDRLRMDVQIDEQGYIRVLLCDNGNQN